LNLPLDVITGAAVPQVVAASAAAEAIMEGVQRCALKTLGNWATVLPKQ
jgi:hypothetical protein